MKKMQNELEKFVFSVSIWYTLFVYNNLKIWKKLFYNHWS